MRHACNGMGMDRREFLRKTGCGLAAAAAAGGPSPAPQEWAPKGERPKGNFDLVVVKGKDPSKMVTSGLDALGALEKFIAKGDNVLIKPNIAWERTPEQAANTNPQIVATLVKWALQAGAKSVTVTDNSVNPAEKTFPASGIQAAAEAAGARVSHMTRYVKVPMNGRAVKEWEAYADYPSFDKVINVPVAKHHRLSQLTICLKNYLGLVGGKRGDLHKPFEDTLSDLAAFFTGLRPTLHVVDAMKILLRNGPRGGNLEDLKETNTICLGYAPATLDAFAATLFGLAPDAVGHIKAAADRGLGSVDLKGLKVKELQV